MVTWFIRDQPGPISARRPLDLVNTVILNSAYLQSQRTVENRQVDQVGSKTRGYLDHLEHFFLVEKQGHSRQIFMNN